MYLQKLYFQISSHSEVLGGHDFWEDMTQLSTDLLEKISHPVDCFFTLLLVSSNECKFQILMGLTLSTFSLYG